MSIHLEDQSTHPTFEVSGSQNHTLNNFGGPKTLKIGYLDPRGSSLYVESPAVRSEARLQLEDLSHAGRPQGNLSSQVWAPGFVVFGTPGPRDRMNIA